MSRYSEKDTAEAKAKFLAAISEGLTVEQALAAAGRRSENTYDRWRAKDPEFRKQLDNIRLAAKMYRVPGTPTAQYNGDFESFRARYLGSTTFPHQLNILDVIEGRRPRWLHESMSYTRGEPGMALINVPPEHAKSMTFSIDYPTYRIATEPNIKVVVVSKTAEMAKQFLYGVQQRLTHPRWQEMQLTFAPGGFKQPDAAWQSAFFYLGQNTRDSTEKDPTMQALGIGGHLYGTRSDLIILDDCVVLSNAHEYEKQIRWIQQEVITRLGDYGTLIILGTRVDSKDLYSEIIDPERYPDGRSPFTVLRMPAVLQFDDDPQKWVPLWPKSDQPWQGSKEKPDEQGLYRRWSGETLDRRRKKIDPKTWAMVYQQQDIPDDGVFLPELVRNSVNGARKCGRMDGAVGHAFSSHQGLYVICSLDPAVGGDAGAIVLAVDRQSKMRYVLDAEVIHNPLPRDLHGLIRRWTSHYQPNEWRIEKNGLNRMLTQDESIRTFLTQNGVPLVEHFTGKEVWDADFGVAGMAPLFGYKTDTRNETLLQKRIEGRLIELPSSSGSEGIKALIEQLITWAPQTKNKRDMVMALWFAEIRAKELTRESRSKSVSYVKNEFLTPDRQGQRTVINIAEYLAESRNVS